MSNPFFSVIVPAYNRESTIAETLRSIADQTFLDFETIVVNDGSTDKTCEVVQSHSFAQLINSSNQGPGAARNLGVSKASGKYVAFLDSDDLWLPWTLQNYFEAITIHQAKFLSGVGIEWRGPEVPAVMPESLVMIQKDDYINAGSTGLWVGTCGVVVERQEFLKCGGFLSDNINAEDSDLWMRLGALEPFVRIESPVSYLYRRSKNSATGDVAKSVAGGLNLLRSEKMDIYPGGRGRRRARQGIIGAHVRPICIECLRQGRLRDAFNLYLQSFWLNLATIRLRFLIGTPLISIVSMLKNPVGLRKTS